MRGLRVGLVELSNGVFLRAPSRPSVDTLIAFVASPLTWSRGPEQVPNWVFHSMQSLPKGGLSASCSPVAEETLSKTDTHCKLSVRANLRGLATRRRNLHPWARQNMAVNRRLATRRRRPERRISGPTRPLPERIYWTQECSILTSSGVAFGNRRALEGPWQDFTKSSS